MEAPYVAPKWVMGNHHASFNNAPIAQQNVMLSAAANAEKSEGTVVQMVRFSKNEYLKVGT